MKFVELGSFDVVREDLAWPWIAFDASGKRFAFAEAHDCIATRELMGSELLEGPRFALPKDVALKGVQSFSLGGEAALLAFAVTVDTHSLLITCDARGEQHRTHADELVGEGFKLCALVFSRNGDHLWVSAESATETAIVLVDARTHARIGIAKSPAFPRPSMHELCMHPQDDAVLLLAACGQDGTFARIVGWSGGGVEVVVTALDEGSISAGFVGFSADGARVHLAEADELRTHAWPGLHELSSVELADDFVSSYAGAVLGEYIYVDGAYADEGEDAVMRFNRSAIAGTMQPGPVPTGMWAGRLGRDALVTVESKGEPSRGKVVRIELPEILN